MDPEHFANIFWLADGQPADKRRISLWLNSILLEVDIRGAVTYSFKHASSIELERHGLETTQLNIFAHHRINDIVSQLVGSHSQTFATQTISQQRGGAIERSNISTLPGYNSQHSGESTLSRSSIAQILALSFYETLPVGRGIEPTDKTKARSDMIYIDQHDNDDMSRQQDQ
ncbi:MAG: hypothetical protein EZS28_030348 [Streblomastix strix]|uniref:Uncharacterized protein n=1 Tax=Streblomastix strix TaxID=222440 RepID=A0A5J4UV09_9EUKA|nr:MAG: hypothetical protein EZS28_030348 [Streblomastix strix]